MKKPQDRRSALHIGPSDFKKLGYKVIDMIAEYYEQLPNIKVTTGESPQQIRSHLPDSTLPENGKEVKEILEFSLDLLTKHSLHTGHPRFWGYISGSGTPAGVLSDLIASALNPNLGGYVLSPMATEIELQTIRWLAEFTGYPKDCGGILVSGGNMANMIAFWVARRAMASQDIRSEGVAEKMTVYAAEATHTWIQKAADLSGLGTYQIRWIEVDRRERMKIDSLKNAIQDDIARGYKPFLVIANAGTVSTGAVDPLLEIRKICDDYQLWMHADGAYGGLAAVLPEASDDLKAIRLADSLAIDPHKWMYVSLEAGCVLIKTKEHLRNTFSYKPPYYSHETHESQVDFHEYGPQNSRSFRALKVWIALQMAGKNGYIQSFRQDIELCQLLFELLKEAKELEPHSHNLSIVTFRFVPEDLLDEKEDCRDYLNLLNERILLKIQKEGEAFISNAIIHGTYLLRICIVNHRTKADDIRALPGIVVNAGRKLHLLGNNTPIE